ncbi:hypothetical protein BKA80DRAFT_111368 [Phyllosticta citrichinensis]
MHRVPTLPYLSLLRQEWGWGHRAVNKDINGPAGHGHWMHYKRLIERGELLRQSSSTLLISEFATWLVDAMVRQVLHVHYLGARRRTDPRAGFWMDAAGPGRERECGFGNLARLLPLPQSSGSGGGGGLKFRGYTHSYRWSGSLLEWWCAWAEWVWCV